MRSLGWREFAIGSPGLQDCRDLADDLERLLERAQTLVLLRAGWVPDGVYWVDPYGGTCDWHLAIEREERR